MKQKTVVLGVILSVIIGGQSFALTVIDQQSPLGNESVTLDITNIGRVWQQEVTVWISGILVGIDFFASKEPGYWAQLGTVDLFINRGSGWQTDTNDLNTTVSLVSGKNYLSVLPYGLYFNQGDRFVIGFHGSSSGTTGIGTCLLGSSFGGYGEGVLFTGDGGTIYNNRADLGFSTYMETGAPVPEPGTMVLLGSGLMGLAGMARRRASR